MDECLARHMPHEMRPGNREMQAEMANFRISECVFRLAKTIAWLSDGVRQDAIWATGPYVHFATVNGIDEISAIFGLNVPTQLVFRTADTHFEMQIKLVEPIASIFSD